MQTAGRHANPKIDLIQSTAEIVGGRLVVKIKKKKKSAANIVCARSHRQMLSRARTLELDLFC